MEAPRTDRDPAATKANRLKLVEHSAEQVAAAEAARANAIRFAADGGASLRQIADAAGLSHMTVKRMLDEASGS